MIARKLLFAALCSLSLAAYADEAAPAARKAASTNETAGALAKQPPPKAKPATATKKVGEACKTSDDCAGELICGKGKCEIDVRDVGHPAT